MSNATTPTRTGMGDMLRCMVTHGPSAARVAPLLLAAATQAQIELTNADRLLHARATWDHSPWCFAEHEDSLSPDPGNLFGAWGEGVSTFAQCSPEFFSAADVKQKSQFLKSLFIVHVDTFGVMKGEFESTPSVDMTSSAFVEFSAPRATAMRIVGTLEWNGQPPAGIGATVEARLRVSDASGATIREHLASPASVPFVELDETIALQPGAYALDMLAYQFGVGGFGEQIATSVLEVSVTFSCYADCDASGSLDFFDFLCFQNEFANAQTYADCDASGSHDFFDFLCFQNAFSGGCL